MEHLSIGERIREVASAAAAGLGLEFVHSEVAGSKRNPTVRVFIDKEGGVSVEDCAEVSRSMESVLDADDFIPSSYVLEVSSPGIERELYSLADFVRFTGKEARVKAQPINGQRNFSGRIEAVENNAIVFNDKTSGLVTIPYDSVVKANLLIDLENELKRR
jgi:ribosome maturation factor RimP